jgi:hypothetical protein
MDCPKCQREIQEEWVYCYNCGTKLRESGLDEKYTRILAMYEYEQTRRQALDTKAATYIGLISVIVTVLLALGSILFSSLDGLFNKYVFVFIILLGMYICSLVGFTLSAAFAFRAYHTGSVFTSHTTVARLLNSILCRLIGAEIYRIVIPETVLQLETKTPEETKRELAEVYSKIWKINHDLNNLKSDRILTCYTFSSISLIIVVITGIIIIILRV